MAAPEEQQPIALPPPLDAQSPPPLNRYCDLVMQGGVVDGVIYPGALIELARAYRFQSIAGTSVGAIAASLAAASEFARRFGSDNGFNEVLRKIPQELGKPAPGEKGSTKLRSLFQPDPSMQRLFNLLVDVLSVPASKLWASLIRGLLTYYRSALAMGLLFGLLVSIAAAALVQWGAPLTCRISFWDPASLPCLSYWRAQWVAFAVFCLMSTLAGLLVALRQDYRKLATSKGFGFCSGLATKEHGNQGLIEWLQEGIQAAARLPLSRPLTFGDLWRAPGGPQKAKDSERRSIDLRMIASSVSHGRPYEFPHDPASTRLFFRVSEFKKYFPQEIMAHLELVSQPYTKQTSYESIDGNPTRYTSPAVPQCGDFLYGDLYELPVADLPILVATRLSMNFPILFKAVPLWAIDIERGAAQANAPVFKRAWFSDGGITANFPVHFFDSPLPSWPTFGIVITTRSRKEQHASSKEPPKTWITNFHTTGRAEKWLDVFCNDDRNEPNFFRYSEKQGEAPSPTAAFWSYLLGIALTSKDWSDNANLRMPGIRDRVVTVYKNSDTNGGLNLKLSGREIEALGYINGRAAGEELVKKYDFELQTMEQKQKVEIERESVLLTNEYNKKMKHIRIGTLGMLYFACRRK